LLNSWATPQAHDTTQGNPDRVGRFGTKAGGRNLNDETVAVASAWLTPSANEDAAGSIDGKMQKMLTHQAKETAWATPIARDWKDGANPSEAVETNCSLGRQAPRSMKNGNGSSLTLNPLFVEWLMNWPIGWTDCASAVTGLSHWLRHMRSELSQLLQASTSDQLDLFA
jgi:DNA (cytosine-5)-methyltransferase 1